MDLINSVFMMVWIPQLVIETFNWIYWIQVKEYRFDRIYILSKSKESIKELHLIIVSLIIILLFISLIIPNALQIVWLVLLFFSISRILNLFYRKARYPKITLRSMLIIIISFILISLEILSIHNLSLRLLIGEIMVFLSPIVGVLLTVPFVTFQKRNMINKVRKILENSDSTIVGITGSFGKTTTKEFVAQILGTKFKVVKTIESENTILGVINRILLSVKKDTEILVTEIGAYKKGEIKEVTDFLHPSVGVITGIEGQHLDLFGSIDNIKNAKFELIESLPKGGLAIFNENSSEVSELVKRARRRKEIRVISFSDKYNSDVNYKILESDINSVTFKVFDQTFSAPIHGIHFVECLVAGILIAKEMGMSFSEIKKGVRKVKEPGKTMSVKKINNSIIIDDSHNASERGFKSALNYLELFGDKKKVVITPGIIELGTESFRVHTEIGKEMSQFVNEILLTKNEFKNYIAQGLGNKKNILKFYSDDKLKEILNENSVVLLEGRMPSSIYKIIDSKKDSN